MSTIDPDTPLGRLVAERPAAASVLERLGLDYCCGGDRSLAAACRAEGLDPGTVVRLLDTGAAAALDDAADADPTDWSTAPLGALIDHIEATHHAYLRRTLPRLADQLATVAQVHGDETPWIRDVQAVFDDLKPSMEAHIAKEEDVVFPFIRSCAEEGPTTPPDALGTDPIALMEEEHDDTGESLRRMRDLSDDFSPPDTACASFRSVLNELDALAADTHQHVHKENHILFPRARDLL